MEDKSRSAQKSIITGYNTMYSTIHDHLQYMTTYNISIGYEIFWIQYDMYYVYIYDTDNYGP